jgi:hypothetical protein
MIKLLVIDSYRLVTLRKHCGLTWAEILLLAEKPDLDLHPYICESVGDFLKKEFCPSFHLSSFRMSLLYIATQTKNQKARTVKPKLELQLQGATARSSRSRSQWDHGGSLPHLFPLGQVRRLPPQPTTAAPPTPPPAPVPLPPVVAEVVPSRAGRASQVDPDSGPSRKHDRSSPRPWRGRRFQGQQRAATRRRPRPGRTGIIAARYLDPLAWATGPC